MSKSLSKYFSCLPISLLALVMLVIALNVQVAWLDIMEAPDSRYYFPAEKKESESSLFPDIHDPHIKIEEAFLYRCRFPGDESSYWGAFLVSNTYTDRWVQGEGDLRFKDDTGKLLGLVQLEYQNLRQETPTYFDFVVPADGQALFLNPDLHFRGQVFGLDYQKEMSVELNFSKLELYETHRTESPADWGFEILEYGIEEGPYPKHHLRVGVENRSENKYYRVHVTALIFNDRNELVDILLSKKVGAWQRGEKIASDHRKEYTLQSLSRSGACLGPDTGVQNHALVSIKYLNAIGTPGEALLWIELPRASQR